MRWRVEVRGDFAAPETLRTTRVRLDVGLARNVALARIKGMCDSPKVSAFAEARRYLDVLMDAKIRHHHDSRKRAPMAGLARWRESRHLCTGTLTSPATRPLLSVVMVLAETGSHREREPGGEAGPRRIRARELFGPRNLEVTIFY